MNRYLVQPRDQIFLKDYELLPFAKNMAQNIDKNISKILSSKHSQKILDNAEQSLLDPLKKSNSKTAQGIYDLTGNRTDDMFQEFHHRIF